ncbi:MAG: ABC transporter ATP-binding protein [Halodesulfurarchaeum sp.]
MTEQDGDSALAGSVRRGAPLLEISELKKYFGGEGLFAGDPVKAVDGVSFTIRKGETLGLVGESGCGKTTLGRTILQLSGATGGSVTFRGVDITQLTGSQLKDWQQNAQMVFQDPDSSLNDRMTVGEIVREPLDVHDWKTPADRRHRVRELLATVGLRPEHYYRYPHQFSGGQRQRIGVARSLALEPEFLVLDEPVSALDVSVQAQVLNLLEDLQEEFGLTYLLIAHDLAVVRHSCDRVLVMYLGNIMEVGETETLFEHPANPYTIALLSAIPEPDPTVEKEEITLRGTPPSPSDPPTGCPFSTRCPMKIRPDGFEDVSEAAWEAIEVFRTIVRERGRVEKSLGEILREQLGLETRFSGMEEILEETFGDVDIPPSVQERIEEAADLVGDGDPEAADELLTETFGSVCDVEKPDYHELEPGQESLCHRHGPEYEDPETLLDREVFVD